MIPGVSCGGVWRTRDNGANWTPCATGMRAEYLPPAEQFNPNAQDPHCAVRFVADQQDSTRPHRPQFTP